MGGDLRADHVGDVDLARFECLQRGPVTLGAHEGVFRARDVAQFGPKQMCSGAAQLFDPLHTIAADEGHLEEQGLQADDGRGAGGAVVKVEGVVWQGRAHQIQIRLYRGRLDPVAAVCAGLISSVVLDPALMRVNEMAVTGGDGFKRCGAQDVLITVVEELADLMGDIGGERLDRFA